MSFGPCCYCRMRGGYDEKKMELVGERSLLKDWEMESRRAPGGRMEGSQGGFVQSVAMVASLGPRPTDRGHPRDSVEPDHELIHREFRNVGTLRAWVEEQVERHIGFNDVLVFPRGPSCWVVVGVEVVGWAHRPACADVE